MIYPYPNATYYIIKAEDLEHREGPAATIFMTIGFFGTLAYFCRVLGKRMGIKRKYIK
jgi:hypothetical protein